MTGAVHPTVNSLLCDLIGRTPVIRGNDPLGIGIVRGVTVALEKIFRDTIIRTTLDNPDTGISRSCAPVSRHKAVRVHMLEIDPDYHVPAVPPCNVCKEGIVGER